MDANWVEPNQLASLNQLNWFYIVSLVAECWIIIEVRCSLVHCSVDNEILRTTYREQV